MSTRRSFTSQNLEKKDYTKPKLSEINLSKPKHLAEKCPIEISTKRLFDATKKSPKKQKLKRKLCSSESLEFWLKPGISLPKLQTKIFRSRPDAGEPFENTYRIPSNQKLSSSSEKTESSLLSKPSENSCTVTPKNQDEFSEIFAESVGPSRCQFLFQVPSSELLHDDFQKKSKKIEPNHALAQWDLWMKRRKHLQDFLCKNLERRPCDLLINQAENFRKVYEDKIMLSYVQIPEPDKWRGHPYRWKAQTKITWKDDKTCQNCPEYYAVRTKLEKGIIPPMEFIGVPIAIQKEKGLVCVDAPKSVNSTTKFWEESSYRRERCHYYKRQRKKLMPNHIQMEELAIVGTKFSQKVDEESLAAFDLIKIPKIQIDYSEFEDDNLDDYCISKVFSEERCLLHLCIKGEDFKIDMDENNYDYIDNMSWEINFGLNTMETLTKRSIKVENKGTIAVSYEWAVKNSNSRKTLNISEASHHEPWFFFDKNPGIFVPGQIYEMVFYHYCKKAGVRTEFWYLKTSPKIFKNADGAQFVLTAVATEESPNKGIEEVGFYLKKKIANSIAMRILTEILFDVTHPVCSMQEIEYRSIFLEKDLFEFHNPKHFYHSDIVDKLREIFKEIAECYPGSIFFVCSQIPQTNQSEWDLSLNSLLKLTSAYGKEKIQDSLLQRIGDCAKKLLRPNYKAIKKSENLIMTYNVLCKMVNSIEEDYTYLKKCLSQKKTGYRTNSISDYYEVDYMSSTNSKLVESEEKESNFTESIFDISPINFIYFQTMFYLKVYQRVIEMVDQIADIIESRKLFEPWKKTKYDLKSFEQH